MHDSVYNYEHKKELNYNEIISDARAYSQTEDILDFCFQFGCRKAYKGCEETYYKLNYLFTDEEIEELEKELQEKGY